MDVFFGQGGDAQTRHAGAEEPGREAVSVIEDGVHDAERRSKAPVVIPMAAQRGTKPGQQPQGGAEEGEGSSGGAGEPQSIIQEMLRTKRQREQQQPHRDGRARRDADAERFQDDVAWRPDNPTLEDYAAMPIAVFGEALLRGQGWEPGKPIGLHNAAVVEPVVAKPRPGVHLGLGATEKTAELQRRMKELRRKRVDVAAELEKRADAQHNSSRSRRDEHDKGRDHSRDHSREHRSRHHSHSHSRHEGEAKEGDKHKRGLLVRVSKSCVARPEFRGLYGVLKDWEGAEEGEREQALVRLQNVDQRKELGAREVWLPMSSLAVVEDPKDTLLDSHKRHHHSHSHHHSSSSSSDRERDREKRAVYDFWYKTTHDRLFMDAPLEADHLRAQREAQRQEEEKRRQEDEERRRAAAKAEEEEEQRRRAEADALAPSRKRARVEERGMWAVPGLVVRIRSRRVRHGSSSLVGRLATVVDAVSAHACTLHVLPDAHDPRTIALDSVDIGALSPVVPPPGKAAMVLRGEHKGQLGHVLEAAGARVVVQMDDDMAACELGPDDVCMVADARDD